jgi:hypothetical protein
MNAEFDTSKFHEREDFLVLLPLPADRNRVTNYFKSVGFIVDHVGDFAYLKRDISNTPWQSSDVTQVDFFLNGEPSNHPKPIDSLNFVYLLATLPEDNISVFADVVANFVVEFEGQIRHRDKPLHRHQIAEMLGRYADELRYEFAD